MLTGSAPTLAPSLAVGCVGAVLAFANAAPYATISIYEAHRTRETAAALDWQNRIARAAQLVTVKYGVPGLKYAMDLQGYYGGPPRLPLTVLKPEQQHEIEQGIRVEREKGVHSLEGVPRVIRLERGAAVRDGQVDVRSIDRYGNAARAGRRCYRP